MKKNNTPIFFIGGRDRGYLGIKEMLEMGENLVGACIMQEDPHEYEKFASKITDLLEKNKIPYFLTNSVKKQKYLEFIKGKKPQLIVALGWRTIIPPEILRLAQLGCIALHESLLPRYRGFAPVNWVVINGEKETGVSLFYIDKGVDDGDIIAQKKIPINDSDTAVDVYKKTSSASIELLKQYLPLIKSGKAPRKKQYENKATYTCARTPEDGVINWHQSNETIYNLIRGLSYPYPGAFTFLDEKKMFIWEASIPKQRVYKGRIAGRVITIIKGKGVEVLTGNGILLIEEVQLEGDKKMNASEVVRSIKVKFG